MIQAEQQRGQKFNGENQGKSPEELSEDPSQL